MEGESVMELFHVVHHHQVVKKSDGIDTEVEIFLFEFFLHFIFSIFEYLIDLFSYCKRSLKFYRLSQSRKRMAGAISSF